MIKTINNLCKHEYLIKKKWIILHPVLDQYIICTLLWINPLFAYHPQINILFSPDSRYTHYLHTTWINIWSAFKPNQYVICTHLWINRLFAHYLRSNLKFPRLNMIFAPHLWSTHYLHVILNKHVILIPTMDQYMTCTQLGSTCNLHPSPNLHVSCTYTALLSVMDISLVKLFDVNPFLYSHIKYYFLICCCPGSIYIRSTKIWVILSLSATWCFH